MGPMEQIRSYVMEHLDLSREIPDQEILAMIDEAICQRARTEVLPVARRRELRKEVFYSLRRLDILQELLEDDEITEIMVNGYGKIFYEKQGELRLWEKSFASRERLEDVIPVSYTHLDVYKRQRKCCHYRLCPGRRSVVL